MTEKLYAALFFMGFSLLSASEFRKRQILRLPLNLTPLL